MLKSATRERATASHRNAKGLALAARGMLTQRDARVIELLPDIKVPSPDRGRRRRHAVPGGVRLHGGKNPGRTKGRDPAAGHAVNIDQPKAFVDAVVPFLKNLPG